MNDGRFSTTFSTQGNQTTRRLFYYMLYNSNRTIAHSSTKKLKIVLSPEMCSNDVTKLETLNGTEP